MERFAPPYLVAEAAPVYEAVGFEEKDSLIPAVEKFTESFLRKEKTEAFCLTNSYNNVQILVSCPGENIDSVFEALHNELVKRFSLEQFIGIGNRVDKLTDVKSSAAEAHRMLAYKYRYSEKGVVNVENIVRFQDDVLTESNITFDRVIGCFQDGDLGRMEARLTMFNLNQRPPGYERQRSIRLSFSVCS